MAFPTSGIIRIFPDNVTIVSGDFSLNSDAAPQPVRTAATLDAFYDLRTGVLANAPCVRRNTEKPAASGIYVPAGGDYELQFSPSTIGIQFYDGAFPGVPVQTLDFLDADFPTGMQLSSVQVYWAGNTYFGPSRDRNIINMLFKYFGSTVETWTPTPGTAQTSHSTPTYSITPFLTDWSIVQVMKSFGFKVPVSVVVDTGLNVPASVTSDLSIIAIYNTAQFTVTTPTPNVLPGNIAEINDASNNLGKFGSYDANNYTFKIYWDTLEGEEDVNSTFPGWSGGITLTRDLILNFTSSKLRFIMPNNRGLPYGGRRLMLTGTGASAFFVGEYPLQNFNVTLVDGSGLYKLVEDQTYDTYYDRSVAPVVTTNLKIPDPYVKTGFFPE